MYTSNLTFIHIFTFKKFFFIIFFNNFKSVNTHPPDENHKKYIKFNMLFHRNTENRKEK